MALPDVIDGLAERLQAVAVDKVLTYEPASLQVGKAIYFLIASFTRERAAQVVAMRYRIAVRIAVKLQDNERAEQELAALINPVCAVLDGVDGVTLGGRVNQGGASAPDGEAGYVDIGNTRYRYCDVFVSVTEKGAYGSGI